MKEKHIPCMLNNQGVLIPTQSGAIIATIKLNPIEKDIAPTGTIHWGNQLKGFLLFNDNQSKVISFTVSTMGLDEYTTMCSIENIINYF